MGYFSNGTEGESYEEEYCSTCQHGGTGGTCSVWLAHLMHAYSESGTKSAAEQILETLIPRSKAFGNGKCTMHLPIIRKPLRKGRIADIRRLIAEHQVGLSRTAEEQLLSIMEEVLDEIEYLKIVKPEASAAWEGP